MTIARMSTAELPRTRLLPRRPIRALALAPLLLGLVGLAGLSAGAGCSAGKDESKGTGGDASIGLDAPGLDATDFDVVGDGSTLIPDPTTCEEAKAGRTYLGCDFWPTVTDNIVRPLFDFAAVVANPGDVEATVTVTKGTTTVKTVKVPANGLTKIYLPWVPALKQLTNIPGQGDNGCPTSIYTATVRAPDGAYHLVSSVPVAVYQFNPLEYGSKGGEPGKSWADCSKNCFGQVQCFSYTNDASLLLPSTAMSGAYRIAGSGPWTDTSNFTYPAYFAITGTSGRTTVTVKLSSTGAIAGGGGVASVAAGGTTTFEVNAGEVVMVMGTKTSDFSGTLVTATAPIQIVTGISCTQMPNGLEACDHLEESVLPIETLGKHYFVARPTGPNAVANKMVVRLYGNIDGTKLTYPSGAPSGAPTTIGAGEMVELGDVTTDFEVVGDHELTISTFMIGAGPNSGSRQGDPSQSFVASVEQYRVKYVFLAPDDYDSSYADVVQPLGATLTLDGAPVTSTPATIGSGFGVNRIKLGPGKGGAHVLTSTAPVGLQVMGYGAYTSYQYPGGLNLGRIAAVPPR
jgi:hypothetical protein